eukprot:SM003119S12256  [mRNA]  locus=s3119:325:1349:- [translate_table: standard]
MAATRTDIHWVSCSEALPFICTYSLGNGDIGRRDSTSHSCIHADATKSKAKAEDKSRKQGPGSMLLRSSLVATRRSRSVLVVRMSASLQFSKLQPLDHKQGGAPPTSPAHHAARRDAPTVAPLHDKITHSAQEGSTAQARSKKAQHGNPPPPPSTTRIFFPPKRGPRRKHPPPKQAPFQQRPVSDLSLTASRLLKVKSALTDPLNRLASWKGLSPCGVQAPWVGVFCEFGPHGVLFVSGLDISGLGLSGKLPAELAQLTVSAFPGSTMSEERGGH